MLAQLLRRILLLEGLFGAWLGYWLWGSLVVSVVLALLVPMATLLISVVVSALLSRGPESGAHWWRALLGEIVAGVEIFLLRQPWARQAPRYLPSTAGTPRPPVVLVHGYLCNHRIWDRTIPQLRAQGHAVLAVDLEPVFTSIDDYVPLLEAAVAAVLLHTGQTQAVLVGHSMGGLAIRAWMRKHGLERVARVLTLGTPHVGTKLAKGSYTPNGQQMTWKSPWLATLAQGEDDALRSLLRVAITPQDNIVYPQRAQTLPGITPSVFAGIGHLQMCLDPDVNVWVLNQLADLRPAFHSTEPSHD
ncbi:MAG: lipase family alpha/beta hydrolase [Rhodoferax sp.]|jgi:pimeloyl-ACP methyl ester carboxylesterase